MSSVVGLSSSWLRVLRQKLSATLPHSFDITDPTHFILPTQLLPGAWRKVSQHTWISHSSLPHGCPTSILPPTPQKKREDESVPRETWLFRCCLGSFQEGRVPEHRLQERVCATSSLKKFRKAFTVKSSKDLKTSFKHSKPENLSNSKALKQLKWLKLI